MSLPSHQDDIDEKSICNEDNKTVSIDVILRNLWYNIALLHNVKRVIRRHEVNPNSPTRESTNEILHPPNSTDNWIVCTEHGIHQSFDLTKTMFCRGNVTEKLRFGAKCVKANDVVLDMYVGIGYYTLPAILLGKAKHVYAIDWNSNAIEALKKNVELNRIPRDKITIQEGDSRKLAPTEKVDRVVLGLLPSSEGGWYAAVKSLRIASGGYLHIHGNVPTNERDDWSRWLCQSLLKIILDLNETDMKKQNEVVARRRDWVVIISHVEQVKSYAPHVDHYVADVYVGPSEQLDSRKNDDTSHRKSSAVTRTTCAHE